MRLISQVGASVVIGAVFGAATSLINNMPGMLGEVGQDHRRDSAATWTAIFIGLILNSGWSWAALAFVLGWLSGTNAQPLRATAGAAASGVAGLILATVTYYATQWLLGTDMYWQAAGYWLIRAPVVGLALGVAGTLARRGGPVGLLAALTVPAGAALNMVLFPVRNGLPGETSAAGWAQGIVWAAAATGTAAAVVRFLRARQPRGLATRCHGNSGLTTMMSTPPTSTAWRVTAGSTRSPVDPCT